MKPRVGPAGYGGGAGRLPGDAAVRPAPGGALGARLTVGAKQVMLLAENHWAWAWERTWGAHRME